MTPLYLLRVIAVALLTFVVVFAAAYHWVMFGLDGSREAIIETLNYSIQTITTVGDGNWVPASWPDLSEPDQEDLRTRVLYVKAISVPFMLVGGALFAVLVGIIPNRLSRM